MRWAIKQEGALFSESVQDLKHVYLICSRIWMDNDEFLHHMFMDDGASCKVASPFVRARAETIT